VPGPFYVAVTGKPFAAPENRDRVRAVTSRLRLFVHDVRNAVSVVTTNTEFLLATQADPDKREALLDTAAAARRMLRLASNLRDLDELDAGLFKAPVKPIKVAELLQALMPSWRLAAESRKMSFESELPDLMADTNAGVLTRVVENILDNALRHTPRGGTIRVETRPAERLLRIANTGPAVPRALREHVFATDGPGGELGLGLHYGRRILAHVGARLAYAEEPQWPAVFEVRFGEG
jgi:signal transduction histidine kinase